MAKWDADKLVKALEKADKKGSVLTGTGGSDPKMSEEERQRRYEKGRHLLSI